MIRLSCIALLIFLTNTRIFAQDIKGGFFSYQHINSSTYEGTCYLHVDPNLDLNRPYLLINLDSNTDTLYFAFESMISPSIKKKVYHGVYNYPGPGNYNTSITEPFRISGISNFTDSQTEFFNLSAELVISPFFTPNNSAQVFNYPNNIMIIGAGFVFNPNVWDPDGDSLYFQIVPCFGNNYFTPDSISINSNTGEISFVPDSNGIYSVCFKIEEWRILTNPNQVVSMGYSTQEILFEISSVGINENYQLSLSSLNLYPNPSKNKINLEFISSINKNETFELFNILGEKVFSLEKELISGPNRIEFLISDFASGVYFLRTRSSVMNQKICIQK